MAHPVNEEPVGMRLMVLKVLTYITLLLSSLGLLFSIMVGGRLAGSAVGMLTLALLMLCLLMIDRHLRVLYAVENKLSRQNALLARLVELHEAPSNAPRKPSEG